MHCSINQADILAMGILVIFIRILFGLINHFVILTDFLCFFIQNDDSLYAMFFCNCPAHNVILVVFVLISFNETLQFGYFYHLYLLLWAHEYIGLAFQQAQTSVVSDFILKVTGDEWELSDILFSQFEGRNVPT